LYAPPRNLARVHGDVSARSAISLPGDAACEPGITRARGSDFFPNFFPNKRCAIAEAYPPFDDLIVEAEHITDLQKRTELFKKAQVIFKEEAPWFTIAHSVQFVPVRKEVVGFKLSPFGGHGFFGVDLK
jgi:ABC-type transport system substrate-binding protein